MKTSWVLSALAFLAAMAVVPISSKMIPPFPCDKLDVMMLLDRTESVGPKVLEQVKAVARKILHRLYVAPIQTRLIVASFGQDAQYLNGQAFRDWNTGRSVRIDRLIEGFEGLHNRTNLDKGLGLAFDVYGKREMKERKLAPNVMILFTDGKTYDPQLVFKVLKTKPDDLYIIAANVGKKSKRAKNRKVLDQAADIVIDGTLDDGTLDESVVFNKIMELFNFKPCEENQPVYLSVGEFGCFKTKFNSPFGQKFSISSLEDKDCWLLTKPSLTREQAFERCAWCSWKKGLFLFGLDGKKNCYAGYNASSFYNGGHPSPDNCKRDDKIGGIDSNLVFYLKDCQAFGMENHVISDEQITTSSQEDSSIRGPGRLNSPAGWTARFNNHNQWLQIDLGVKWTKVTRIATQGFGSKWVSEFKITHSNFLNANGDLRNPQTKNPQKFNSDANTVVENRVNLMAQYVRFHPLYWHPFGQPPSMRVELYDCSRGLAPKVSYGSIGCLKSGYERMIRIDNKVVNRMPGNSRLQQCAWAARIEQGSLFTFSGRVCKYRRVFRKMKTISVSQDCANKDTVFFVANTAQWLIGRKRQRDIAVIVDIRNEDVHYLATIADALDVKSSGTRVGIIAVKGPTFKIDLKFNEYASGDEMELLAKINNAGKTNEGNYLDAMNSADELFTPINGDRSDFDNSLLIITDASMNFALGNASPILNKLKTKGIDVVVAGIQSVDQQSQNAFEDMATNSKFGVIVPNADDEMPAFYYKRGITAILKALTMLS